MATIVAKRLADGSLMQVLPDGTMRPMPDTTDNAALDALSEAEIEAAALGDPDALPRSANALRDAEHGPQPRLVRRRLGLSVEMFAARYQIPLATLRDWEEHKSRPDEIAKAYLKAIAADPDGVAKAVSPKPHAAE